MVACALYKGRDKVIILDKKDLIGNIIDMIEDSILFLKKHVRYEIAETQRIRIVKKSRVKVKWLLGSIADDSGDVDFALEYLDKLENAINRLQEFRESGNIPKYLF